MDKNIIIEAEEENSAIAFDMTKIKNHFSLRNIGTLVLLFLKVQIVCKTSMNV